MSMTVAIGLMLRKLPCAPRLPGAPEIFFTSESQNGVDQMIAIHVGNIPSGIVIESSKNAHKFAVGISDLQHCFSI